MTAIELKEYIYKNEKIPYILEDIKCKNIVFHHNKNYYSCSNYNGDNPSAINIFNDKHLGYVNYTRNVQASDHKDLISLVQYNLDIDFLNAIKHIHKILGLSYSYRKPIKIEQHHNPLEVFTKHQCKEYCNISDVKTIDEDILSDFIPAVHIDIFREGIIGKTIKKFGLGYSYRWKRTIFPIRYWLNGALMGYNARTSIKYCEELGISKYWLTPGLNKSINLYGLYENYKSIQKNHIVTIFEAEKSVLKRDSLMDENCVALQGHYMSEEQMRILLGLNVNEIVIALDKDVDIYSVLGMCEKFYGLRKISFIIDKWDILGEKDSPADAHNKDYCFLFDNRVVYNEKLHNKYLKHVKNKIGVK